jgi:glycine/D-amino acid oxidase-like deaminating enzyme
MHMRIYAEDKKELTRSFWLNNAPYQSLRSTPDLPRETDVVVIGGGITGVSTAYWLGKNGINVTLLEQRGLSGGATGRNGGHLHPGTPIHFSAALKQYGVETALAIWNYTLQTTDAIKAFVAEHQVECDLCFTGSVSLAVQAQELY